MVEKCGEAYHIRIRMLCQPLTETGFCEGLTVGLPDVKRDVSGLISPLVGNVVIKFCGVPKGIGQKAQGITMEGVSVFQNQEIMVSLLLLFRF